MGRSDVEKRYGKAPVIDLPEGTGHCYVDVGGSGAIYFEIAPNNFNAITVSTVARARPHHAKVALGPWDLMSSRHISLGDSPEAVIAILGPALKTERSSNILVLQYGDYCDHCPLVGCCYDSWYVFESKKLVEYRIYVGS